jgi:hypothetical protein
VWKQHASNTAQRTSLPIMRFLCGAGVGVFSRVDRALRAAGGRLVLPHWHGRRILAITGMPRGGRFHES